MDKFEGQNVLVILLEISLDNLKLKNIIKKKPKLTMMKIIY